MLHATRTGRLCLQSLNRSHLFKCPAHATTCWAHRKNRVACKYTSASSTGPSVAPKERFDIEVPDEVAPGIILRSYQKQTVEDVMDNLKNGLMRQLLALPTGSGKTVIFLTIARLLNLKTLIITNSVELTAQTHQKLLDIWPGVWYTVIKDAKSPVDRHVVIATVQAASRKKQLENLSKVGFQLLIVDEAHHSTANTYVTIMLNLGFLSLQDAALITGKRWYRTDSNDSPTDSESDEDGQASPRPPATHGLWRLETKKDEKRKLEENKSDNTVGSADSKITDESSSNSNSTWSDNGNSVHEGGSSSNSSSSSSSSNGTSRGPLLTLSAGNSEAEADSMGHPSLGQPIGTEHLSNGSSSSSSSSGSSGSNGTSISSPDGAYSDKIILGCTATPYRRGPDKLRTIFDTLVQVVTIGDLIRGGYLCKIYAERILTYTDISQAVAPDGSLPDAELSKAVDTPERNRLVVDAYLARAADRKAVAFCCTLEHASNLAEAFRERGIPSDAVHSKLSIAARTQLLDDHQSGDIQVLTNVGILTEGYDDTSISCVLMTKPTTSTGLYTQCVGRGLRPHPGKEDCILLDFTDRLHSLDKESDLVTSEDVFKSEKGVTLRNYNPDEKDVIALELRNIMGGKFDIYAQQGFFWVQHFHDYWMSLMTGSANRFKKKTEQAPNGSVWIHLREVEPSLPPAKGTRRRLHYQLCASVPSFNPPIGMPSRWRVLEEVEGTDFIKILKQAEKKLASLSRAKEIPSLTPMKMERWNSKVSWMNEPVSEGQVQLLKGKNWLPADCNLRTLTKGQAGTMITLFKIEEATRKARAIGSGEAVDGPPQPATDKQKDYIDGLMRRHGHHMPVLDALKEAGLPIPLGPEAVSKLNKVQASDAINIIKRASGVVSLTS